MPFQRQVLEPPQRKGMEKALGVKMTLGSCAGFMLVPICSRRFVLGVTINC